MTNDNERPCDTEAPTLSQDDVDFHLMRTNFPDVVSMASELDISLNNFMLATQRYLTGVGEMSNAVRLRSLEIIKERDEANERLKVLDALEAGGVDNWEWYGQSLKDAGL